MHQSIISFFAFVSSAMAAQHSVVVGGSGLTFVPDALTVQVGDTVKFQFFGNHSVAQSTYDSPCVPSDHAPIFSGVISGPDPSNNTVTPTFIMDTHVNGTLWLYCSVAHHCQKGMSMEIVVGNNPDPNQTLDKYQAAAAKVDSSVAPDTVEGGSVGPQSGPTTDTDTGSAATSTGTATVLSGSTTATTTALSTTFTSRASTVTATRSGGSASATGTAATVTATGAAGKQVHVPVALGFAGIVGGLAALI
ncbi:hypothetical protein OCU04_008023 [Sclerotinia nivalis]|uniref:Extracellular serine-rich protein n=1 Tax=Sclerotinia nivalis TaxID=352851 RepID=A0A9X0DH80_9HELO|nr:hypothetical protein OCU04_008023 [Sclerotinia nivalis]